MDRSLWLLLRLRWVGWLRRWGRNLRSLKGVILTIVGSLAFVPMSISMLLAPRLRTAEQLEAVRRFGPLALLTYCVLNVFLSSGDRAITYSPGEVNFLFSGPFRPRQLLLYKIIGGIGGAVLTAFFLTIGLAHHASRFLSAYVGLLLAVVLLYLFSLAVGLLISVVGALAFSRTRKALLIGMLGMVVVVLVPLARDARSVPAWELAGRALSSPSVTAVLLPFRPFINAFTSERVWPDLLAWSAVSGVVDLALASLVLALNAQFLEASAAASARRYALIGRLRRGNALPAVATARFTVPMLPWWGGVGPILWRQANAVSRSLSRLSGLLILFLVPLGALFIFDPSGGGRTNISITAVSIVFSIALFAPSMVGYDFRFDLDHMEELKALPIRPTRLVLGQLATPVLILFVGESFALGLIASASSPPPWLVPSVMALTLPLNLVLVAVENLYFLWFPFRLAGANSLDFQALGRQILLMIGKLATLGLAAGIAGAVGAAIYHLTGGSWSATVATAAVALTGIGVGMILLVALAFEQFDVAGARPE